MATFFNVGAKNFYIGSSMKFSLLFLFLLSLPAWAKWSVSTYNIRNFDRDPGAGKTDLVELGKIIKDVQSDVMAFEEVVNEKAFADLVKKNLPGYVYEISACGGAGKQHLAVVYNPKVFELVRSIEDLTFSGDSGSCDSLRPVLLVTLKNKTSKTNYTFGAVHLKAGGNTSSFSQRWAQYTKLLALSKTYAKENLILLGDFNSTGYNIKDRDYQKFEDFITSAKLRTMTETLGCTNYWEGIKRGPEFQSSILDHIILQDKNVASTTGVRVGAHCAQSECRPMRPSDLGRSFTNVSDHCPVQVTFK
jgi:endonuclease/exonuclease/phosphatase family metal-dependent hydrolase